MNKKTSGLYGIPIAFFIFDIATKIFFSVRHVSWEIGPITLQALSYAEAADWRPLSRIIGLTVASAVLVGLGYGFFRTSQPTLKLAFLCLFAGGFNNSLERVWFNQVTDIIHVATFSFNLADIAIVAGLLVSGWYFVHSSVFTNKV